MCLRDRESVCVNMSVLPMCMREIERESVCEYECSTYVYA